MHYYQFNIGDYVKDTQHLTEMEDLAYRRMLDLYYRSESELPGSVEEIARLIRMRSHCDCIALVLQEFFERTATGYANSRVEKEISAFKAKSEKAKASAKSRWSKNNNLQNANALPTQSEGNANHKPLTINQYIPPIVPQVGDSGDAEIITVKQKRKPSNDYSGVMSKYNEISNGRLPAAEKVTQKRKRAIDKLLAELKEPTVECAENYFHAFFEKARPFYFGDNDRGWKADFDYVLRVETMIKTKEGAL